jgi:hypothetical protein
MGATVPRRVPAIPAVPAMSAVTAVPPAVLAVPALPALPAVPAVAGHPPDRLFHNFSGQVKYTEHIYKILLTVLRTVYFSIFSGT